MRAEPVGPPARAQQLRILVVSLNFAPEPTGIGKYSGEMAHALAAQGHEVRVVCAPPYYPAWRVAEGHVSWRYRREQPAPGLTVQRCPVWVPRRPRGVARLLHLASYAASVLPPLLAGVGWRPSVVMVVAPAIFSAPVAWFVARLSGARSWLHVQDFELDAGFALGLLRGGWLQRAVGTAERALLRRFDRVSTLSHRMLERLHHKGVDPQRSSLLPNWVDTARIRPTDSESPMRGELGIDSARVVCLFSGTMNRKQGLSIVVEAALRLRADPRILIVLCGDGDARRDLEAAAGATPNLRFLGLQPAERLNDLLNLADIHLLPQERGAADLVMPSKLGGMLASGRPVVATAAPDTEIARVVTGRGVVVPPGDSERLAAALAALADDPDLRRRAGAAARAHAESALDARAVLHRLDAELVALCGFAGGSPRAVAPAEDGVPSRFPTG